MPGAEIKFEFKGFTASEEFTAFANERLMAVSRTAPFGATCLADIEINVETGQFKTSIKLTRGADQFHGTSVDSDIEKSLQRCLGQVRSKTFKWRKDKLAQKNKPRKPTADEAADPFAHKKKRFFTG